MKRCFRKTNSFIRANLKGVITEANEAFCQISGFTREEMIGQPHNIVRHPDVPEAAFADLWRDMKAGLLWSCVVKNRRKDGGFYWVVANASPVRENGKVIGYQSVRSRPSREQVNAAEAAFKRIKNGDSRIEIRHGWVRQKRPDWLSALVSLRGQMFIMGLFVLILGALGLAETLFGLDVGVVRKAILSVAVLYALYFLVYSVPKLGRDLETISGWLDSVLSTGNLRQRLVMARGDTLGKVGRKMDVFVSSVQATVQGMSDTAKHVENSTREVNSGMQVAMQSAQKQSEATAAAAAVEEVTVSISEVAEHAQSTRDVAMKAGGVSREGAARSEEASEKINALAETVKDSAAQVETLGQRSAEISQIVGVIREIADQTNLLALNAAIEVARAGEQGRGFAVVADEVRKLAERTSEATQEIGSMIDLIQNDTLKAVEGMRAGAAQVEAGVDLVHASQDSLELIKEEMDDTINRVNEISHASAEQREAMTLLAQNVEQVAAMTEQNVAVVNQTDAMEEKLTAMIDRMKKSVNQFTI